jgi:hypothetical protein
VRPKAWTVLRGITHASLERRGWLRGDGIAEKHRTCSGDAGPKRVTTSWLFVIFGDAGGELVEALAHWSGIKG